MLSREMYEVLKRVPRYPNVAYAGKIFEKNDRAFRVRDLLLEAEGCGYINVSKFPILDGNVSLTETGQAAIEAYERAETTHKIAEESLRVAKVAKWVAIFSAVAAFVALIAQIKWSIVWNTLSSIFQSNGLQGATSGIKKQVV